jgi:hypothetical protein
VPVEAASPISPALARLREYPEVAPEEVPDLLERFAGVPDPRDPRGVRHALGVMPALTACAVLAGATSLLAVGEWIADAPSHVLECLGVRPDPLSPGRCLPAETTVRRLLARIDGDAPDRAVGRWLADRRPRATGLRGLAVDLRVVPTAQGSQCSDDEVAAFAVEIPCPDVEQPTTGHGAFSQRRAAGVRAAYRTGCRRELGPGAPSRLRSPEGPREPFRAVDRSAQPGCGPANGSP